MLTVTKSTSILLAFLATAAVMPAQETLFGSASYVSPGNNSEVAVQLIGSYPMPAIFSGVSFPIPPGLTFSGMTTLSTDFKFTAGDCVSGSPRFQIRVFDPVAMANRNIFVYIGPPPNYVGCPFNTWTNTGNLLAPANLIDTSQLTGGAQYDPEATAQTKFGTWSVLAVSIVADQTQTVLVDNVRVNADLYTFDPPPADAFQVSYSSNLTQGDSIINMTNSGASGASLYGPGYGTPVGNLCINVYAFSPDEQLISCCSCLVTPNGLVNVTANRDLVSNTLTGIRPNSIVVKLVATAARTESTGSSTCTNSAALAGGATFPLTGGLLAWGTTLHSASSVEPPPVGTVFSITETPFSKATLNETELASITSRCANILGNGSTFGQCRSCRLGGLGGAKI
jgi:hypothetical protein